MPIAGFSSNHNFGDGSRIQGLARGFQNPIKTNSPTPSNKVESIYKVKPENWYQAKPYGFVFYDRSNTKENYKYSRVTFWLPIRPENITTTTHFATNIVNTLYGVVEEHSPVRWYDINISGTTGYAPSYYAPIGTVDNNDFSQTFFSDGRENFEDSPSISVNIKNKFGTGGFGGGAISALNQIAGQVSTLTDAVGGDAPVEETGVDLNKSGYIAFHNLYRFLLLYKKDGAGQTEDKFKTREIHPLEFVNYKDGIKYSCIPTSFTLTRSASSPMLYNYNIKLRAYNLRDLNAKNNEPVSTAQRKSILGLEGAGDKQITAIAGAVRSAVSSIASLF